jgi:hypothetical protein
MSAAVLTAHPARVAADFAAAFRRGRIPQVVHAVADQPVTISPHSTVLCPVTRSTGEPLCGTLARLKPSSDDGLFPEPVTCVRCLAVAARENVTIGGST